MERILKLQGLNGTYIKLPVYWPFRLIPLHLISIRLTKDSHVPFRLIFMCLSTIPPRPRLSADIPSDLPGLSVRPTNIREGSLEGAEGRSSSI